MDSKYIKMILMVTSLIITSGCSKNSTSVAPIKEGGQDSGGGDTLGSNNTQVEYYLLDKIKLKQELVEILSNLLAKNERFMYEPHNRNVIKKFEDAVNKATDASPGLHLEQMGMKEEDNIFISEKAYEKYEKSRKEYAERLNAATAESNFAINYQQKFFLHTHKHDWGNIFYDPSKFIYNLDISHQKICKDRHFQKKAASVSDFARDAKICISTNELLKIPPDSLRKQLHALIIHEISHLLGFYEGDALLIQEYILKNYDQLIERGNPYYSLRKTLFDKPKQLSLFFKYLYNNYKPSDFLNQDQYRENGSLFSSFKLLEKMNKEIENLIFNYTAHIELNFEAEARDRILEEIKKLQPYTVEIDSLCYLIHELHWFIGDSPGEISKLIDLKGAEFIHQRFNFFSKRFAEIDKRFQNLNVVNEQTNQDESD